MAELTPGIKGVAEITVDNTNTAASMQSGCVRVFATPMMVAIIEKAAMNSVEPYLEKGQSTVGTLVNVTHCAATPVGMKVKAESELIDIDKRRLIFKVKASDESGLIGEGTHERFIIDKEKFQAKTDSKK